MRDLNSLQRDYMEMLKTEGRESEKCARAFAALTRARSRERGSIHKDLLGRLAALGPDSDTPLFRSRILNYLTLWDTFNSLTDDIGELGTHYTDAKGYYRANPQIAERNRTAGAMNALLDKLRITTVNDARTDAKISAKKRSEPDPDDHMCG